MIYESSCITHKHILCTWTSFISPPSLTLPLGACAAHGGTARSHSPAHLLMEFAYAAPLSTASYPLIWITLWRPTQTSWQFVFTSEPLKDLHMILSVAESAFQEGWGEELWDWFHTLDRGGVDENGWVTQERSSVPDVCACAEGGGEGRQVENWQDRQNLRRWNDFFSFQASRRAVRLHHLLPAWWDHRCCLLLAFC